MKVKESVIIIILALLVCFNVVFAVDETAKGENTLIVHVDQGKDKINKNIYGHFSEHLGACIYGGFWVGEDSSIPNTRGIRNDVVEALRAINIPVLRWPGGCFADEYHWKNGIGPREKRPAMVNTHWGGVTENNHFGTHEFLDLCEQLGCEPYICGNLGSGTVQEMQEWVEYITFDGKSPMADLRRQNGREKPWKLKYFGIGNENWGCGGNMEPAHYADLYRQFRTYVRDLSGNRIFAVACGAYGGNYEWTETLMKKIPNRMMAGIAPHYYCGSGKNTSSATNFEEVDWFHQLKGALHLDELVTGQSEIMDKSDPEKKIAMLYDEWGAWHSVEPGTNPGFLYQQNSLRDAMVAGLSLNIFNQHCDRVKMANIAQTINVLQAMILTKGEQMILTPTYHVFDMYKVHQDATLLPVDLQCGGYRFEGEGIPGLNVSASRDKSGTIHISVCNVDPRNSAGISCQLAGFRAKSISAQVLTAPAVTSHNTFEKPFVVVPGEFNGARLDNQGFTATVPAKSIVMLEIVGK